MPQLRSLVTGGAGFIGSHLAERLMRDGHAVTVLDNLSTGRHANVKHLEGQSGFSLIIDSVMHERLVEDLVKSHDRIFHLASAVGVKLVMDQPVKTIETIVGGTDIVLRHCARYRKRVLLTSTSEVYGKGTAVPFKEDDDVLTGATSKHRWAYACAKALDEFLALAHWRETRLPVSIVRLFNTVGPRQTGVYGMVVPRFVAAALSNQPLIVHGDGKQTRCFAHVADIVDALVKALEVPECFGQVVNLGSDREISIDELAQTTVKLLQSKSEICHLPYEQAYGEGFEDMRRRVPGIDRAKKLFGYAPKRTLDEIIREVAADIQSGNIESQPNQAV